jgi:hypothetical protein
MNLKGLALLFVPTFAYWACGDQSWEKRIAPGITYRQEVRENPPLVVNSVRIKAGAPGVEMVACKSKGVVYDETPEKGRETVSSMVRRASGVVGVNADFFQVPYTGESLGLLETGGQLVTSSLFHRTAMGWGNGSIRFGVPRWQGTLTTPGGTLALDSANHQVGKNDLILLSSAYGIFELSPSVAYVEAKIVEGKFSPGGVLDLKVSGTGVGRPKGIVPKGEVLVVGSGKRASELTSIKVGDSLTANLNESGFDWAKVTESVSGGPKLVTAGKIDVEAVAEGFSDAFSTTRHPRTAVGTTHSGDVLLVVVDGRQPQSVGASLAELAEIMIKMGCSEAMNLDGGGSSDLAMVDGPLNRPSDGGERAVADGIVVRYSGQEPAKKLRLALSNPAHLGLSGIAAIKVTDHGRPVSNREIFWMSSGAAWIDQGGTVHPIHDGLAQVKAYVRGSLVQATISIGSATDPQGKRGLNEDGQ